jgi:hypothetical protein
MRNDPGAPEKPAAAAPDRENRKPPDRRDPVVEASEESFPASDPPSWAPLQAGPPGDRDE